MAAGLLGMMGLLALAPSVTGTSWLPWEGGEPVAASLPGGSSDPDGTAGETSVTDVTAAADAPAAVDAEATSGSATAGPVSTGASTDASTGASTGASTAAASASAAATGCGRAIGTTPKKKLTTVSLPAAVRGYGGEGDTEPLPMAIAARPGGGSWLAWLGTDGKVWLAKLNCKDKITGTPRSFAGVDLQDVQADAGGGVLLLTRKGSCGPNTLCGGSPSPCYKMHMIRFDNAGKKVWDRQVTNLTSSRKGYTDGARFVWWYQHHGRLAYDGTNYAAYFGVAITVKNGSCVDIHEGDRMQVVSPAGKLLGGHQSFEVGCSHAWTSRIVWDPRTSAFVMTCATDNGCRIAQPNPYRTVASGTCDGTLFGGDLVLARGSGAWSAWSQGGKVRLARFTTGAANKSISTGVSSQHPHLVRYGAKRMLLTWQKGSKTRARVYHSGTGAVVGSTFTINVKDHDYTAWKTYKDGSVAYAAAGGSSTTITIARVLPMA